MPKRRPQPPRTTRKQREADKAHADGKGRRQPPKPTKAGLWDRSAVETDPRPESYRRRKRTRCRRTPWAGAMVKAKGLDFARGEGLAEAGKYRIEIGTYVAGYCDDPSEGLGWVKAAQRAGHDARLYV